MSVKWRNTSEEPKRVFGQTFDRFDIGLTALNAPQLCIVRLEPVRNDQLSTSRFQHPRGIPEEERLVGEMAESLGDPHGVERRRVEARLHLLSVKLQVAYFPTFGTKWMKGYAVVARLRSGRCQWRTSTLFAGEAVRDHDLSSTDGDAGDCAA